MLSVHYCIAMEWSDRVMIKVVMATVTKVTIGHYIVLNLLKVVQIGQGKLIVAKTQRHALLNSSAHQNF